MRLSVLGALLSVPALASLIVPSVKAGCASCVVGFSVYGTGLLGMFIASAVYHSHARSERGVLKNFDYCGISLMIAGNFTPFCVVALRTTFAYWLLALVWAAALASGVLRIARPDLPKSFFVAAFTFMGGLILLVIYPLLRVLGPAGTGLTVLGGMIYAIGAVLFNRIDSDTEHPVFGAHDIWHIFILAAASIHFLVFRLYMLPA